MPAERRRRLFRAIDRMATRSGRRAVRDVLRYAQPPRGLMGRLRNLYGAAGELLAKIAATIAGDAAVREADVQDAIRLLEDSGYRVAPEPPAGPPVIPPPLPRQKPYTGAQPPPLPGQRPGTTLPPYTGPQPPPLPSQRQPQAETPRELPRVRELLNDDWPEEHFIDTSKLSPERSVFDQEIQTPESSNVFAFSFDRHEGILYVVYKARGKPDKEGKRPHVRGPMYSYGGRKRPVPAMVFLAMVAAVSKGRFVWDELRVRGTLWGHQYPYTLVEADYGGPAAYVPRKATRRGYRVRSVQQVSAVRTPGQRPRRQPHLRSTLPPRDY